MAFIVFEGLDGSGKTTQIHKLTDYLRDHYKKDVVITREPGGTALGEEMRELLLRMDNAIPTPRCELLIYEAARAQHVDEVIRPALERGEWVLCDRFTASTVAFQSGGRELELSTIDFLNDFATGGLKPHLTIYIDISVDESESRKHQRSLELDVEQDRFEQEKKDFHQKVRNAYLEQANKEGSWLIIDGSQSVEEIFSQITDEIEKKKWPAS